VSVGDQCGSISANSTFRYPYQLEQSCALDNDIEILCASNLLTDYKSVGYIAVM